ncbi:MAG: hypothetical protein KGI51_02185 [Rhodospirillales bacterium]|nr:hypothetical protein [Rhodospirillales bacterium]
MTGQEFRRIALAHELLSPATAEAPGREDRAGTPAAATPEPPPAMAPPRGDML